LHSDVLQAQKSAEGLYRSARMGDANVENTSPTPMSEVRTLGYMVEKQEKRRG